MRTMTVWAAPELLINTNDVMKPSPSMICGMINSASAGGGVDGINGTELSRNAPISLYRARRRATTRFGALSAVDSCKMPWSGDGRFAKPGI